MGADKEFKRVMVIDDDQDMAISLAAALEDQGFRVTTAYSAEEAVRKIERTRPDCICLDVMMPGQSGIGLYRTIKRDPELRGIPAIFISGVGTKKDFIGPGWKKLVADPEVPEPFAYLEKPQDLAAVIDTVRRALE